MYSINLILHNHVNKNGKQKGMIQVIYQRMYVRLPTAITILKK